MTTLMSTISATDVKNLREMTGAGMMDCKAALTEANGDVEKAIEILRLKGQKLSVKELIAMLKKVWCMHWFLLIKKEVSLSA
jgi:hypothetical protein